MGFGAARASPRLHGLGRQTESRHQRGADGSRQFVLDGEHVVEIAIVGVGPHRGAVAGVHQAGGDAQPVALAPHAALHHVADAQFLRDLGQVTPAAESLCRGSRHHAQPAHLGEHGRQVLYQAEAEVVVLRIGAGVLEGQHGDTAGRGRWRRTPPRHPGERAKRHARDECEQRRTTPGHGTRQRGAGRGASLDRRGRSLSCCGVVARRAGPQGRAWRRRPRPPGMTEQRGRIHPSAR